MLNLSLSLTNFKKTFRVTIVLITKFIIVTKMLNLFLSLTNFYKKLLRLQ